MAKLGDRAAAEDAMARSRAVLDRLPDPVHPDHHFVVDPAKADFYALDMYRWLGADDAAEAFARAVLDHSVAPDGTVRAPMRRSEALLTLGTIAARRGELNTAVGYGLPALGDPRKCKPSLLLVAADLAAYQDEPMSHSGARPWPRCAGRRLNRGALPASGDSPRVRPGHPRPKRRT